MPQKNFSKEEPIRPSLPSRSELRDFKLFLSQEVLILDPVFNHRHADPAFRALLKQAYGMLEKSSVDMLHLMRAAHPAVFTNPANMRRRRSRIIKEIPSRPLQAVVPPLEPPRLPPRRSARKSRPKAAYKGTCDDAEDAGDSDAAVEDADGGDDSDGSPACAKRPRRTNGRPSHVAAPAKPFGECMPRRCIQGGVR